MKKIVKPYQVWKNSKNKDLWIVMARIKNTIYLVPVKDDGSIRRLTINNFLSKYYFDTTYYLLHGNCVVKY